MKVLKIIGIVSVVLIVLFLAIGLAVPSYEYESSIRINASPEKCWKTFHNVKLMSKWMPGFESLTLKSGDSLAVGSTYEIVIVDGSERMVMSEKITEVSAPTKVAYELNNDVLKSDYSYSFEGSASTNVKCHYRITGNNIAWKAILFLSKSYMSSSAEEQLTGLKKVVEERQ